MNRSGKIKSTYEPIGLHEIDECTDRAIENQRMYWSFTENRSVDRSVTGCQCMNRSVCEKSTHEPIRLKKTWHMNLTQAIEKQGMNRSGCKTSTNESVVYRKLMHVPITTPIRSHFNCASNLIIHLATTVYTIISEHPAWLPGII